MSSPQPLEITDELRALLDNLNYTRLVPYNGTYSTGGDSATEDLNLFYKVCKLFLALRGCCCDLVHVLTGALLWSSGRRYCLDAHGDGAGMDDDSWRWVSAS